MIIDLKPYHDCGKCSYGTLKPVFDTEKDEIRLKGAKVSIKSVKDLFPFLWCNPTVSSGNSINGTGTTADFYGTGTWWHQRYDADIEKSKKEIDKIKKKIEKLGTPKDEKEAKRLASWKEKINWEQEMNKSLTEIMKNKDKEVEQQKQKLIEANKVNA